MTLRFYFVTFLVEFDNLHGSNMWKNVLAELQSNKASPPLAGSPQVARILSSLRPLEPRLEFPKLAEKQVEFGVNPGYQAFHEPKIRILAPRTGHDGIVMSDFVRGVK